VALDPLEVGGRGTVSEQKGCSFEEVGIFNADPSLVFPCLQVCC